jgi:hypothetical protein
VVDGPTGSAEATTGGRVTVPARGRTTTAYRVRETTARTLLDQRPARSLTLDEAAYVVAWMHQANIVRLRIHDGDGATRAPRFRVDDAGAVSLAFPGPDDESGGRFIVSVDATLTIGGRPFQVTGASERLRAIDVRNVIVVYHLGVALLDLSRRGVAVTGFHTAGINGRTGHAGPTGQLFMAHGSGRACDFMGVNLAGGHRVLVSQAWGRAPLPPGAPRGNGTLESEWPVFTGSAPNWMNANWNSAPYSDAADRSGAAYAAVRAAANGRAGHTATWFRLRPNLPPDGASPANDAQRDALIFHTVGLVFARHTSIRGNPRSRAYDAGATGDVLGASETDRAVGGILLHPDHTDAVLRQTHYDHYHSQIGNLGYEFPSRGAADDDLKRTQSREQLAQRMVAQGRAGSLAAANALLDRHAAGVTQPSALTAQQLSRLGAPRVSPRGRAPADFDAASS